MSLSSVHMDDANIEDNIELRKQGKLISQLCSSVKIENGFNKSL